MTWHIIIDFDAHPERSVHKIRNFGEALWHACRTELDDWASIPMMEVDVATDQLQLIVKSSRRVRRTVKVVEELLRSHFLDRCGRVSTRDMDHAGRPTSG